MDVKWAGVLLLGALGAGRADAADKIEVDVYLQGGDWYQLPRSTQGYTSELFARIGVQVRWHAGELPAVPRVGRQCIGIRMVEYAPVSVSRQILASAQPFASGSLISVYEDRVKRLLNRFPGLWEVLLAYVFAHELAHVMIGTDYHSDGGVLKARWSNADLAQMFSRRLAFLDGDSDRIHQGMTVRLASH